MAKGGGNSHDRAVFTSAVEKKVVEVLALHLSASAASPKPIDPSPRNSKFTSYWNSTSVWSAICVLIGVTLSQSTSSAKTTSAAVFVCSWAVFVFEFWRLEVLKKGARRSIESIAFGLVFGFALFSVWRHLPKPKEEPNLDRTLKTFGDSLAKKLSGSTPLPAEKVTNVYNSYTASKPPSPPRLDMAEPRVGFDDPVAPIWQVEATNDGDLVAENVSPHNKGIVLPISKKSSDGQFAELERTQYEEPTQHFDIPPGKLYSHALAIYQAQQTTEQMKSIQTGDAGILLGLLVIYHDSSGRYFRTESCYWAVRTSPQGFLAPCDGHNKTEAIKPPK